MSKFNQLLAVKVTNFVGSMGCAYLFSLIALVSLPAALASRSMLVIIGWLAQTFLQLVLLSVIMVGQNMQAEASEAKLDTILEAILKDEEQILADIEK